jgi:hypothetical protein
VAFLTAQLAKDDYLLAGVNDDRRFEREVRACLRKLIKEGQRERSGQSGISSSFRPISCRDKWNSHKG